MGCIQNQCDSIIITATFQIQNQLIESTIYPNPTDEQLTINLSKPLPTKAKIHIFNQTGQPVLQQNMLPYEQNLSLNTTQLPNGIYEVILQTDEMHSLGRVIIHH